MNQVTFAQLGIAPKLLPTLNELGYETPTPIQTQSIPILLQGEDLLAQAQTGTGKTAAFALPILSHIDIAIKQPQTLIVVPTRELAIQVAEAFQRYAKAFKDFHVIPIYGGQDYQPQLRALKRGVQVIVGTPGRLMDHLRRGTFTTEALKIMVLDEADEMLRMGFIDDVEWILSQIKQPHQTALFSATMPVSIQKITQRYLKDAKKILIKPQKNQVDAIEQFYLRVANEHKLDALTRFLDVEDVKAALIFTRTKTASDELAERLKARGYSVAALNGDMPQNARKKVIEQIKSGKLDIVVATDVAARGIDIERMSHVINFDIPTDTESYIHRIGRTGRAGRSGKAILFVTPKETRLLKNIEHAINKPIPQIQAPTLNEMQQKRSQQLAKKMMGVISKSKALETYRSMINNIINEYNLDPLDMAAALTYLNQQSNPLPDAEMPAEMPVSKIEPKKNYSRPKRHYDSKKPPRKSTDKPKFRAN